MWQLGNWEGPMFERIHQYELMTKDGRWYRPRAYANPRSDSRWDGWLVFVPLAGGQAIATDRETTQATRADVALWAAGLGPVYLDGALERALALADESAILARLDAAEYEALEDAEQLETAAAVERAEAEVDEAIAQAARKDAARIHQDRLQIEGVLATAEKVAATRDIEVLEEAAGRARARAADAARRANRATAASGLSKPETAAKRGRPKAKKTKKRR
jgi:hypothetical protein